MHLTNKQLENFWNKVNKTKSCWLWTAGLDKDGYGKCSSVYGSDKAHRASFVLSGKKVGFGIRLNHTCNIRACVNPRHLERSTAKLDALHRINTGTRLLGNNNGQCLISDKEVLDIRHRYNNGSTGQEIAAALGISVSHTYRIISGNSR